MLYRDIELPSNTRLEDNCFSFYISPKTTNLTKRSTSVFLMDEQDKKTFSLSTIYKSGQDIIVSVSREPSFGQHAAFFVPKEKIDFLITHFAVLSFEFQITNPIVGDEFVFLVAKMDTAESLFYKNIHLHDYFYIENNFLKVHTEKIPALSNLDSCHLFKKILPSSPFLNSSEHSDFCDFQHITEENGVFVPTNKYALLSNVILSEKTSDAFDEFSIPIRMIDDLLTSYTILDIAIKRKTVSFNADSLVVVASLKPLQ